MVTLKPFLLEWTKTFVPSYKEVLPEARPCIIQQKGKQMLWTQDALAAEKKEMQSACVMIINLGDKN